MRGEIQEIWDMFEPIDYVFTFTEIFMPLVMLLLGVGNALQHFGYSFP